ncbi:hypothetical protein [Pseudonocardia sp. WMMC193]|uniref:hypothetical protein n=1 Tax=Pseudonocardia sp. WMMC193 TaxID=2911965 RepID=UPI001F3ACEF3|nr:hypothetical protein [Pseudonocardia sp. WMMC193]MCF7551487.1 hypothetical protein [Pseudonocardia sp. WMMC193]
MARHAPKHGARRAAPVPELEPHDPELDSYLAALAPDPAATGSLSETLQVRLPGIQAEELRRVAAEQGVTPAALAAAWLVERLGREEPPTGPLRTV